MVDAKKDDRPHGCFWDQNGGVYFNKRTTGYKGGWGGVGAMCRRRGPFLEPSGAIVSKPGDKWSSGTLHFETGFWISQETAKKRADLFFPDGKKCAVGLQVWLHKEYDGSEDLAGPFLVTECNPDDDGLYMLQFARGSLSLAGNRLALKLQFTVGDLIYLQNKDGGIAPTPVATVGKETTVATTAEPGPTTPDPLIKSLQAKLAALQKQLTSGDEKTTAYIQKEVEAVVGALGDVKEELKATREDVASTYDGGLRLEGRVAKLESSAAEELDAQDFINNGFGKNINDMEKRLEAMEAKNAELEAQLNALSSPAVRLPAATASCTECAPEIASVGDEKFGLAIRAQSGKVVFESDSCRETDLCDLARDVAAIKAKFVRE